MKLMYSRAHRLYFLFFLISLLPFPPFGLLPYLSPPSSFLAHLFISLLRLSVPLFVFFSYNFTLSHHLSFYTRSISIHYSEFREIAMHLTAPEELQYAPGSICNIHLAPHSAPSVATSDDFLEMIHADQQQRSLWFTKVAIGLYRTYSLVPLDSYDVAVRANMGITIAEETSPSSAVFRGEFYAFYNGECSGDLFGHHTTYFMIIPALEENCRGPRRVHNAEFDPKTSPSAVVFENKLYVFWTAQGNIHYCTFDGETWTQPASTNTERLPRCALSSPCAVVFDDDLYVFYDSESCHLPMFEMLKATSDKWTGPSPTSAMPEDMHPRMSTSLSIPSALVLADPYVLRVYRMTGPGTIEYVDFRKSPDIWTTSKEISLGRIGSSKNFTSIMYHASPFLLWAEPITNGSVVRYSHGLVYEVKPDTFDTPAPWIRAKKSFTLTVSNEEVSQLIYNKFGGIPNDPYRELIEPKHDRMASRTVLRLYHHAFEQENSPAAKLAMIALFISCAFVGGGYSIAVDAIQVETVFQFLHEDD